MIIRTAIIRTAIIRTATIRTAITRTTSQYQALFVKIIVCCLSIITLFAYSHISHAKQHQTTTQPSIDFLPDACYHSGQYRQSRIVEGLDKPVESSGEFIFSCENGLIWHTQAPLKQTMLYPIKGNATRIQDGVAEQLDGRLHRHLGKLLNAIIGAKESYLNKHFKMYAQDDTLRLEPTKRRMKKFISSVNISQHDKPNKKPITNIALIGKSEFNTTIEISDTKEYNSLSAASCEAQFKENILACQLMFK